MPTKITVTGANAGTVDYVYSADRSKLCKINSNGTITDYIGNFVYENGSLKQITQPEGYTEPDANGWQYVYRYADIWGNTRLTYADDNKDGNIDASTEIRREQNYYPFGLEHKGYNNVYYGVKNNLKTYQKQEFTEDLGLNTHEWKYRMSDSAIGRFWQIDPLAEKFVYNSPYAFQENKLGMGIELEGLENIPFPINNIGKGIANAFNSKIDNVVNSVETTVVDTGKAIQTFVTENKTEILSFSKNLQEAGNNTAVAGLAVAAAGTPVAGVGAAPGLTIAAVGGIASTVGSGLEIATNLIAGDTSSAVNKGMEEVAGEVANKVLDKVLPGPTPDMSKPITDMIKVTNETIKNSTSNELKEVIELNTDN